MKPTIIGSGDGGAKPLPKPTTIGIRNASASKLPTVIGLTPPQPATVVVRVEKPSAIPGTTRKRIPATREILKQKHRPKDSVLDEAIRIIETTNQDELTLSKAILWGQPLQEQHNALVSESLTLAQSEVVSTVTGHVHRMMEILGDIQLEEVFEKGVGFIANALRKASKEIDTPEELDGAMREIEQLSGLMRGRINELVTLREKLESNSKQIEALGDNVEASMVAALAVADHFNLQLSRLDMSERLQERAASLTVTLGQIRSNGLMRNTHIEQPMNLTTLVQNVVFTTLPSWMTSVAALRMALHGNKKPNPTEVSEISRVLKTIIRNLS